MKQKITISSYLTLLFSFIFQCAISQSTISSIEAYGAYETIGVKIQMSGNDFDENAKVYYKKTSSGSYQEGHDLVRFDGNHMATSLFNLELGTSYDIKVDLFDPDNSTTSTSTTTVSTQAEFSIPTALRTVNVTNSSELNSAISGVLPGDHIVLAAGDYTANVYISGKNGTAANPVVIKAADNGNMPKMLEGITIYQSSYFYLDYLDITTPDIGGGYGVNVRGAHHTAITNCYIHDCGGNVTSSANIMIQHSDESLGPDKFGYHLVMNNLITEEDYWNGIHSFSDINGHTYFGIRMEYQPGGRTIIRGNTLWGMTDGISPAGNESQNPVIGLDDNDILNTWWHQELDIYDNVIYHLKDDAIELDGRIMNCRVFRNRLGDCTNSLTTSKLYPGPVWIIRNTFTNFYQGAHKLNTGTTGETRNIYFYHNTIIKPASAEECLYRGGPQKSNNIVFKNNILHAEQTASGTRARLINTDIYGASDYIINQVYDYNLWYSVHDDGSETIIKYESGPDGAAAVSKFYKTLDEFRDNTLADFGRQQAEHGIWGKADLDLTLLFGLGSESGILDFSLLAGSPGIDVGVLIPGINDNYSGNGPDIGAFESSFSASLSVSDYDEMSVHIYPVPVTDRLNFSGIESANAEVEIFDMLGKLILSKNLKGQNSISLDQIKAGIYILRLKDNEKSKTIKIIVQ